jgi:hypothetical protein
MYEATQMKRTYIAVVLVWVVTLSTLYAFQTYFTSLSL